MKNQLIRFVVSTSSTLLACLAACILTKEAIASETVMLEYGFWQEWVSIAAMQNFIQTGKTTSGIRTYLKIARQEPEQFQSLLTQQVPVNPVKLYKALISQSGESVLDRISEVIRTPSGRASRESLRSALVGSALADENISLIEVFAKYPTQELYVDGNRLTEVYSQIQEIGEKLSSNSPAMKE